VSDLRVLFVCGADFAAPSEKQVLGYAAELTRLGHEVAISIGGDPASIEPVGGGDIEGLRVWRHRIAGRRPRSEALDEAAAFGPTLIHAFNLRHPVVCAARAYAQTTHAPVFVHFEDDEWGLAAGRDDAPAHRRAARQLSQLAGKAHAPLWPFATRADFEWAAGQAAALDALVPTLAEHVTGRLGRDCRTLLPPMPRTGPDGPADLRLPTAVEERPLVVYTGAVFGAHEADFRLGLQAIAELQGRDERVAFVHAGAVAPRFDVRAMAEEAGVERGSACALGHLSGGSLHELLRRATVLVQPGHPTEFNRLRLPSKLQLYLSSGTPTVTFAVGAGELLDDRTEVLKTYGTDPSELADRIAELLRDPGLRRTLAEGGSRAAARLFDTARNTESLLEHYGDVLT
jgi:glycosyltransferase involved in cell wall biosynthesis